MKKIIPFLFLLMLGSISGLAQNTLLSQKFYFSESEFEPDESPKDSVYLKSKYNDWDFSEYCYGIKKNYLQVGQTAGSAGSVTPPTIPFYGRVQVVVRIKQITKNNNDAFCKIKLNGEELKSEKVPKDGAIHSVSFIVDDWSPSSSLVISNASSSYYVLSVEVYDIGPALFYESFNGMEGATSNDFSINASTKKLPTPSLCDNTSSVISINSDADLRQANGALFFYTDDANKYTTPAISNAPEGNVLLSFKAARQNSANYDYQYYFKVSASGGAQLSDVNSLNVVGMSGVRTKDISDIAEKNYVKYKFIVSNLNGNTLSFTGYNLYLDDILLQPLPPQMADNTDNTAYIEAYAGMEGDVTITRTLVSGKWNTLCLPFDVTSSSFGADAKAELRTLTEVTNNDFVFNSTDQVPAGTPFLVKVAKTPDPLTFQNVTIQNVEAGTVDKTGYQFCGTYSPVNLITDGTQLFLGTDGKFYKPSSSGNRMNGMRAYFVVPKSASSARITILDEPSAIQDVRSVDDHNTCYDLMGRRQDSKHLSRGLYVRDGRKFYVK